MRALIDGRGWAISPAADSLGLPRRTLQAVLGEERNVGIRMLDVFAAGFSVHSWNLLTAPPISVHRHTSRNDRRRRPAKSVLAHAIRARAWELSLSLEDVARAAGRSRSGVYNVAHAHVSCGIDLLPLLARVLRIELHELLIDVIDLRQR